MRDMSDTPDVSTQQDPGTAVVNQIEQAVESAKLKPSWFFIKDSSGYPSVTVTLVMVSFLVTTIAYILSVFQKVGPFETRPFDPAATSGYLGLVLATYTTRKWTDAKYSSKE